MGMAALIYYTAEMVRALPDDGTATKGYTGRSSDYSADTVSRQQLSVLHQSSLHRACAALSS